MGSTLLYLSQLPHPEIAWWNQKTLLNHVTPPKSYIGNQAFPTLFRRYGNFLRFRRFASAFLAHCQTWKVGSARGSTPSCCAMTYQNSTFRRWWFRPFCCILCRSLSMFFEFPSWMSIHVIVLLFQGWPVSRFNIYRKGQRYTIYFLWHPLSLSQT